MRYGGLGKINETMGKCDFEHFQQHSGSREFVLVVIIQ